MQIYPYPYRYTPTGEEFPFGEVLEMRIHPGTAHEALEMLWKNYTYGKGRLQFVESADVEKHSIRFGKGRQMPPAPTFSYTLTVEKEGGGIFGRDTQGLLQGFMSLLQRIRLHSLAEGDVRFTLAGCRVEDKPRLDFRAIHLCLMPGMELFMLQKILRLCAFMKYSHIILEFWGTYRFAALPELGWENTFTYADIRPIIEEARALGLTFIPMFNHLGHATQARAAYGKHVVLDQAPEKALLFGPDGWTWNIRNPEVPKLLGDIREELLQLFGEGEHFHLGFDEAFVYEEELSDAARNELLLAYMNGLCDEMCNIGRRPIIWGDMFLEHSRWQANAPKAGRYSATGFAEHEILPRLDKRFIFADWQYYITEGEIETNAFFRKQGFDVIACPWNKYDNVSLTANSAKTLGLYGMMQTTWANLSEDIIIIPYSGTAMWEDAVRQYSIEELGVIRVKAMNFIRRLMPSGGVYAKAGWKAFEI